MIEIARNKMPVHTADLAVNGADLAQIITDGAETGTFLKYLLERVRSGNLPNERAALLEAANTVSKKHLPKQNFKFYIVPANAKCYTLFVWGRSSAGRAYGSHP